MTQMTRGHSASTQDFKGRGCLLLPTIHDQSDALRARHHLHPHHLPTPRLSKNWLPVDGAPGAEKAQAPEVSMDVMGIPRRLGSACRQQVTPTLMKLKSKYSEPASCRVSVKSGGSWSHPWLPKTPLARFSLIIVRVTKACFFNFMVPNCQQVAS